MKKQPKSNLNIFAERLNELMKEKGMTQEKVACGIGVTRQGVGKWVSGDSVPDVLTAAKLADFLGVSVDYLSGNSDVKTSNTDLKAVCEFVGLSEYSINSLRHIGNTIADLNLTIDPENDYLPLVSSNFYQQCIDFSLKHLNYYVQSLIEFYLIDYENNEMKERYKRTLDCTTKIEDYYFSHNNTMPELTESDLELLFGSSKYVDKKLITINDINSITIRFMDAIELKEEDIDFNQFKISRYTKKFVDNFYNFLTENNCIENNNRFMWKCAEKREDIDYGDDNPEEE